MIVKRSVPTHPRVPMELLGDFAAWKSTGPPSQESTKFGLISYVTCVATPDLLFAFAELLAPDLVEYRGSYFIAERFDESIYDEWRSKLSDPRDIERVVNHVHISTLFQDQDVPDEVAVAAARLIADAWTRQFRALRLVGEAYGDSFGTAEVTLHSAGAELGTETPNGPVP